MKHVSCTPRSSAQLSRHPWHSAATAQAGPGKTAHLHLRPRVFFLPAEEDEGIDDLAGDDRLEQEAPDDDKEDSEGRAPRQPAVSPQRHSWESPCEGVDAEDDGEVELHGVDE
eukprot:1328184-Rhodomonas_salina.1